MKQPPEVVPEVPVKRRRKCENGSCPESAYYIRTVDGVPLCPKCAGGKSGLVDGCKKLLGFAKWDPAFVRAMAKKGGDKIAELGVGHRYTSETGRLASLKGKRRTVES